MRLWPSVSLLLCLSCAASGAVETSAPGDGRPEEEPLLFALDGPEAPEPEPEPKPESEPDLTPRAQPPAGRPRQHIIVGEILMVGGDQRGSYSDQIRKSVRDRRGTLAMCTNFAPDRGGTLVVELAIGTTGRIQAVAVAESDLDGEVSTCLLSRLRELRYPEQPGTGTAKMTLSVRR